MAFTCTVPDDALNFELVTGRGQYLAVAAVGHDDETDCLYKAVVAFSPYPMCRLGEFELSFHLTGVPASGGDMQNFHDGSETRQIITKAEDRRRIQSVICGAVKVLAETTKADLLVWFPKAPHLPAKALTKYEAICGVLEGLGYEVKAVDRFHGHTMWIANRESCE